MDNGLLTVQLFLGTMYGGLVAVPLNVRAGAMQLSYMLDHCDAKVVFVEDQYAGLLREALADVRREIRVIPANVDGPMPAFAAVAAEGPPLIPAPGDMALLMYSSGSTGKPKGAIHTHSTVLAHGRNSIESHQLSSADRSLLVLPLYHINAECVTLIPTLLSGGSVVVAHRFVVSKFWDWVDDLHVTWSALVPTIIAELVDWEDPKKDCREAAFQRIRFFRSSSAPLSPALHRQFLDKFNLPLLQAMGSTEGGNVFSNPQPPAKNKIGSPGLAWGFLTRIVDRQGVEVPDGEAGEILLRGPAMMKGYYKDPDGTAAVLDKDGWFHTGDLARRDEDGYFFIVGRSKELIIKGGVNIAPRQIDEVLELHPSVMEAAAVGIPDRYFGEDAVAFVVLRPGAAAEENELLAFCESRLGHFKTPSRIHYLKQLPKGPSGKVQRLKLLDPAVLEAAAITNQAGGEAPSAAEISLGNGNGSLPSSANGRDAVEVAHVEQLRGQQGRRDLVEVPGKGRGVHGGVAVIVAGQQEVLGELCGGNLVELAGLGRGMDGRVAGGAGDGEVLGHQHLRRDLLEVAGNGRGVQHRVARRGLAEEVFAREQLAGNLVEVAVERRDMVDGLAADVALAQQRGGRETRAASWPSVPFSAASCRRVLPSSVLSRTTSSVSRPAGSWARCP